MSKLGFLACTTTRTKYTSVTIRTTYFVTFPLKKPINISVPRWLQFSDFTRRFPLEDNCLFTFALKRSVQTMKFNSGEYKKIRVILYKYKRVFLVEPFFFPPFYFTFITLYHLYILLTFIKLVLFSPNKIT